MIEYFLSNEKEIHNKVNDINIPLAIVATNLAGRGTDIKINKKLEKKRWFKSNHWFYTY